MRSRLLQLLLVLFIILVTLSLAQACWCKCCCCQRRHSFKMRRKHLYPKTQRFSRHGSPAQKRLKESFLPKKGEIVKRPASTAVTKIHPLGHRPVFLKPHVRRVTTVSRPLTEGSPAQRSLAAKFSPKTLPEKESLVAVKKSSTPTASIKSKKNEEPSADTSLTSPQDKSTAPVAASSYSDYRRPVIVLKPPYVSQRAYKSPTVFPSGKEVFISSVSHTITIKLSEFKENDKQRNKSKSDSEINAGPQKSAISKSLTNSGAKTSDNSLTVSVNVPKSNSNLASTDLMVEKQAPASSYSDKRRPVIFVNQPHVSPSSHKSHTDITIKRSEFKENDKQHADKSRSDCGCDAASHKTVLSKSQTNSCACP